MVDIDEGYRGKAWNSLAGAESELSQGRRDNAANRCYYACFQAAIGALIREKIRPSGTNWSHEFVQAQFVGQLINRRKLYPPELRQVLRESQILRTLADYSEGSVSSRDAARVMRSARHFVTTIQGEGPDTS